MTSNHDEARRFAWTAEGWDYRPHSSPGYRPSSAEGVIEIAADSDPGDALVAIITGQGEGATLEATIPWGMFTLDREIRITFGPQSGDPA